jgi:hypothetical protein
MPSTSSENPSKKDNTFVNNYIHNELDEWNDDSVSKGTFQIKTTSNKSAFITNLKLPQKKKDKSILLQDAGYLLGDLRIQ